MKKIVKRRISLFLSLLIALSVFAFSGQELTASAETLTMNWSGQICYDQGITFTFDKFDNCYAYRITIQEDDRLLLEESWIPSSNSAQTSYTVYGLAEKTNYEGSMSFYEFKVYITGLNKQGGLVRRFQFSSVGLTSCGYAHVSMWEEFQKNGTDHGVNYCVDGKILWKQEYTGRNVCSGYETVTSNIPSKSGYTFLGWSLDKNATSASYHAGNSIYHDHDFIVLYAVWTDSEKPFGSISSTNSVAASQTATLSFSDNVEIAGFYWGTSSNYANNTYTATSSTSASKTVSTAGTYYLTVRDTSGNLSDTVNITYYTTTLNANGGSVSPASVLTQSGKAFTLPTPTRSGYTFSNWNTASGGTGTKYTGSYTVTGGRTLYAVWTQNVNIYNLGEETYSFNNFGDSDSAGGHCFGMSITSSGYYTGNLDKSTIGLTDNNLYAKSRTSIVQKPICYYQSRQGVVSRNAIVAGGSEYIYGYSNIASDWDAVVNYVKNHAYDGNGSLQIGFRKDEEGGHAINFLRYEEVNGQPRIYAYDNNFPTTETYFYKTSNGNVYQAPQSTFSGAIDCIALRDVAKYFRMVDTFDMTRYIYAKKDSITVSGAQVYYMETDLASGEYVAFALSDAATQAYIRPLEDNAEFTYLDQTYSFGSVDADTSGTLKLVKMQDDEYLGNPEFQITKNSTKIAIRNYVPSCTVDYRTTITFMAEVENPVNGASVHWFINGQDKGSGETYTEKEAKKSYTVQAKYMKDGEVLAESEAEKVNVKTGFFDRLKAFFRALFGRLPKQVQEAYGFDRMLNLLP